MNPIPQSFKEGVFLHNLIHTETTPHQTLAIYVKTDKGRPRGFEVVRFQLRKAESVTVKGKLYSYEDRLVYPSNEQWGTHGFSCVTLKDAHRRLQTMIPWMPEKDSTPVKVTPA